MKKIWTVFVISVLFFGLFVVLVEIQPVANADGVGDWIEEIVANNVNTPYDAEVGDANNDGDNELLIVSGASGNGDIRAYSWNAINSSWDMEIIASSRDFTSISIGDANNDGENEVVVSVYQTTRRVMIYKWNVSSSLWDESEIANHSMAVFYSVAVGDANNDGDNEVVAGLGGISPLENETRLYKWDGLTWIQENITNTSNECRVVAIGDAIGDGENEVITGGAGFENETRAYKWNISALTWDEYIIDDPPTQIVSLATGDGDNDGRSEVFAANAIRASAFEWNNITSNWDEDVIVDAPPGSNTRKIVLGDADNDGKNEVVISFSDPGGTIIEIRAYRYSQSTSSWVEDPIADTPTLVQALTVGDAENDGKNEVAIGIWGPTLEVRIYSCTRQIKIISPVQKYVSGIVNIEASVVSNNLSSVKFFINNHLEWEDTVYPYSFFWDTTSLIEDTSYMIRAVGLVGNGIEVEDSIEVFINNMISSATIITSPEESTYQPDELISLRVDISGAPSNWNTLIFEYGYTDPNGRTLWFESPSLPKENGYVLTISLPSDAPLGTYTINVTAYGYDDEELIWSASDTANLNVAGEGLHDLLEYLNTTLSDMNVTIDEIQNAVNSIESNISSLNLDELKGSIDYLNQTLPSKIDDLSTQLSGVNDSILSSISDAEINILSDLAGVNTSLSADILNLLTTITDDISGTNASLSDQLTSLLNNMTTDNNALRTWLEMVLDAIDTNLTVTKNTLQNQLSDLNASMNTFYNDLNNGISDISLALQSHDTNTGDNHSDIIGKLNDLLAGGIGAEGIEELKTMLINLAGNLSEHNQSIADDIMDVVADIEDFETQTSQKLDDIDNTLDDLAKLDSILTNLDELDQNLQAAQSSIDEIPTEKEEEEGFGIVEGLLFVVIVLLVINILVTLTSGRRRNVGGEEAIPAEEVEPEGEELKEVEEWEEPEEELEGEPVEEFEPEEEEKKLEEE